MSFTLANLGEMVKISREHKVLTQDHVAQLVNPKTNRSVIAHLEQGRRLPDPLLLEAICRLLDIPRDYWLPFTQEGVEQIIQFEQSIGELVGRVVELSQRSESIYSAAKDSIQRLFGTALTDLSQV